MNLMTDIDIHNACISAIAILCAACFVCSIERVTRHSTSHHTATATATATFLLQCMVAGISLHQYDCRARMLLLYLN